MPSFVRSMVSFCIFSLFILSCSSNLRFLSFLSMKITKRY
jgi:hypothetical protein